MWLSKNMSPLRTTYSNLSLRQRSPYSLLRNAQDCCDSAYGPGCDKACIRWATLYLEQLRTIESSCYRLLSLQEPSIGGGFFLQVLSFDGLWILHILWPWTEAAAELPHDFEQPALCHRQRDLPAHHSRRHGQIEFGPSYSSLCSSISE